MFPIIRTFDQPDSFSAGLLYGQLARARIAHSLKAYRTLFEHCGLHWALACEKASAFEPIIMTIDSSTIQELKGVAQGSGFDFESLLALNCRSELLAPDFLNTSSEQQKLLTQKAAWLNQQSNEQIKLSGVQAWPDFNECTSVAVQPRASARQADNSSNTWLAQNWDWMGGQRQALVLLEGKSRAGRFMTLTEAGMWAKIGLNESGFAVGLNIIRSINDGKKPGIAVHWLLRHLLGCESVAQAHQIIDQLARDFGFGGSSNIICADASGAVASFELCATLGQATGYARVEPASDGIVRHTNHFLAEHLRPFQAQAARSLSTDFRLHSAEHLIGNQVPVDFDVLRSLLRNDAGGEDGNNPLLAICRSPDDSLPEMQRVETVAGIIINTSKREFWVAPDIPNRTEFVQVWAH